MKFLLELSCVELFASELCLKNFIARNFDFSRNFELIPAFYFLVLVQE